MPKNTKRTVLVLTTCTLAGAISSGCSLAGRNLLTLKKKDPPAEVLAESGPTSSFPVPPSSQASPSAIASVAGGTAIPESGSVVPPSQPAQLAGLNASPGYSASTASATSKPATSSPATPNLAAAQANGIYGNPATKSVGFQTPASPAQAPSGYTFGSKALTPKASESGTAFAISDLPEQGSAATATQQSGFQVPDTSFASPGVNQGNSAAPAIPQGGFTFPTNETATAAITPPKSNGAIATLPPAASQTDEILPPAATAPAFSTASSGLESETPSAVLPPASAVGGNGSGGYMPGSTGSASGYPSGTEEPATRGSIYR